MKSWRKLRELARFKDRGNQLEPTQDIEEITKGMQDVQHMKSQYEGLHAVSSRVVARAYGFSEAIHELGSYLVNTFGIAGDNGEINQVFREVGREQFELSRLLHLYAFHVSGTLTLPTESLLNELSHIEETKKQYDEKRALFDNMRFRKSRVKGGKLEGQVEQQLQESKEQFDEMAMFLGCRLHSLEQSRPRNLITQAVRHHAAQMHLFRQGLGFLEDIDPYVSRLVNDRNLDQSLDYLDPDNDLTSGVFDSNTRQSGEPGDDSDQSSSLDQETSPPRAYHNQEPSGIRSAPISPLRFSETPRSSSSGVNSIQEVVMLDGVSKKPTTTMFNRSNSWLRRKGSRDPGVLHLYKPPPGPAPPPAPPTAGNHHLHHPYSVTEPPGSPASSWVLRSPEPAGLQQQRRLHHLQAHHGAPGAHAHAQARAQAEVQLQMKKKLGSFPSFPRRGVHSGPLQQQPPNPQKRIVIPGSGPLQGGATSCQILPVDPLYKSGPLSPSPKISPGGSPRVARAPAPAAHGSAGCGFNSSASPPRVSELHKLPPPPLVSSGGSGSGGSSGGKVIAHSAPLAAVRVNVSSASPLPPPPLVHSSGGKGMGVGKVVNKKEERVTPLPPSLNNAG